MNLTFLPGTEIGIVDDLCPTEPLEDLYEMLMWADKNGFQLNHVDDDDMSMMPVDAMEPEEVEDDTEKHYNIWGQEITTLTYIPRTIKELQNKSFLKLQIRLLKCTEKLSV